MSNSYFFARKKQLFWLFLVFWIFLIPIFQTALGNEDVNKKTITVTDYLITTEIELQTIIETVTTTIPSTRTEESEYETYTRVATTTFVPFRTFRLVEWEVTDAAGGIDAGVSTINYITQRLMFITTEIKTTTTDTVTLTESVISTYLTELLTTKTNTIELVRTYETEYVEEDEDTGQTLSIPTNYLLYSIIIVLVIIVAALAFRGRTRISQATYCINCGSAMPGKQKFCPKCGQKQEARARS
jgi:hypothetical protein